MERRRPEVAVMEFDYGDGVPVWGLTDGGSEVGE
jgi:hypothetical protein